MPVRTATAIWEGGLRDGRGNMKLGSGTFEGEYSFGSRFEQGRGSNPEELIGAAHAGCFSMALAAGLEKAGFRPRRIETTAKVSLDKGAEGFQITRIVLATRADVPGMHEAAFREQAEIAKKSCPVSRALGGTTIELEAKLG